MTPAEKDYLLALSIRVMEEAIRYEHDIAETIDWYQKWRHFYLAGELRAQSNALWKAIKSL